MVYKIPKIMAVLNVTPDSFSEYGKNFSFDAIINTINEMISNKVDVIDIGAESTRPGASIISTEEEIERLSLVLPYVHKAIQGTSIKISLDSRNFKTLDKFKQYIDWINDVEFGADPRILELVRDNKKQYCFYFSTKVPVDKTQFLAQGTDLVEFFNLWIRVQLKKYNECGIKNDQLIFDPGLGFGLDALQSLNVIKNFDKINALGMKTLIGHSRKSFLAPYGEQEASKRDPETHVITSFLIKKNVDYIRVHNFKETRRVLNLLDVLYN
jgi:dihydropteroate synthase